MIEIIQYEGEEVRRKRSDEQIDTDKKLLLWKFVDRKTEPRPKFDIKTQTLESNTKLVDGVWTTSFTAVDLTEEQKQSIKNDSMKADALSNGFDTGLGFSLAVDEKDRNAFTQLMVLLRESGAPDVYEVTIFDKDKVPHKIKYGDLKPVLVQYGQYCMTL